MSGYRGKCRMRSAMDFSRSGTGSYDHSSNLVRLPSVHVVEPTHHVEEQRADEDQAVDAIQQSAVTRDQSAHVLDADVALDHADRQISELAADADDNTCQDELQRTEVREAEPHEPGQRHRDRQGAERSAPGFVRTDLRAELAPPE